MKKFLAIFLALVMLLSLAACSSNPDKKPDTPPADGNTPATEGKTPETQGNTPETEGPTGEDHTFDVDYWSNLNPTDPVTWTAPYNYKRVGMVVPDGTDEFYVSMARKAQEVFEANGYELVWTGASDAEGVINTIDTWVTQGVDALILLVVDTACEDAARRAMEEGVLVVLGSSELGNYHVWCNQDYYQIGYNVGIMAAADMKERFGDDASYILYGDTRVEIRTLKTTGVADAMKEYYPNGTAYDLYNSGDIQGDVEALLTQHPDISAFVCWHNGASIPCMAALNSLGLNDPENFAVYGSQMTEQTLSEIKNPNSCYVADTWMGDQGRQYVNVVLTLLNGGTVNHHDYAPDFVVNAENADTYYEDYYKTYGDTYIYG